VKAVTDCFVGQPKPATGVSYTMDPGRTKKGETREIALPGLRNPELELSEHDLLENVRTVQRRSNLPVSPELVANPVCGVNLDVEMETGTGKTYCYLKTMFELHAAYGWSKFIVVVPSIAIREGVRKTLAITAEHFMETYGKRARGFVYDSKRLHELESFSSDAGVNVMIINQQAFNAFKPDGKSKVSKLIYQERDDFQSRRPIDVIKKNRPILILDEPQKLEGAGTKRGLKEFDPLMVLRYSATHKTEHNKIHRLDALDAFNQKLVKKIAVRGIETKGQAGLSGYLYLESIQTSTKKKPVARVEMEVRGKAGPQRVVRKIDQGTNLHELSKGLDQYQGFVVADIDARDDVVKFTNGKEVRCGEAHGDVNEASLRRIQIREAVRAHLEKERSLFERGVKVLTLFFIDEVAKYRQYDAAGEAVAGEYAAAFEEEYALQKADAVGVWGNTPWGRYVEGVDVGKTHEGYFSIDKRKATSGRMMDSKVAKTGETAGQTDDVDAYDLILRDKERLLSHDEPVRFIFSHSALREGWDNPNVFVICALKHVDAINEGARRQEVGRGLRLAVDQAGERVDDPAIVHDVNVLTVVAGESFGDYVKTLQTEIRKTLSARPRKADAAYFTGKVLGATAEDGTPVEVTAEQATALEFWLIQNGYIDLQREVTDAYHAARAAGDTAPLPEGLAEHGEAVLTLVDSVFSDAALATIGDGRKLKPNLRSANIDKKEFLDLWDKINRKAAYTVHFESDELVRKAVAAINTGLNVTLLKYTVRKGVQADDATVDDLKAGTAFRVVETKEGKLKATVHSTVAYDLLGKVAEQTGLTRATVAKILSGIEKAVFDQFALNPEDFIVKAAREINEQKATMIVEHITYDPIDGRHELQSIFADGQQQFDVRRDFEAKRHVLDWVVTDSATERKFVEELDTCTDVVVYAKLPRAFYIPTPVGHYNPDWAIAFKHGSVKHVYFVAETKGSMEQMELREVEQAKTACAKKFFARIASDAVRYEVVDSYGKLMEMVG